MILFFFASLPATAARAGKLSVELTNAENVVMVGAIGRWDADGNPRRLPDPKAKLDAPAVDAKAVHVGSSLWEFSDLPAGKYDLLILAKDRLRVEGFQYAPVKQFDPTFAADATTDDETRQTILDDIAKSRHYENRVAPLYLGGNDKAVRILMMLIRDKTTSYESDMPGAATIRHEMWQYSWNYGAWQKERRTRVLDRAILHRDELRKWTWLWDPKLGGIEIGSEPISVKYALPESPTDRKLKGLYPNY